MNAVDYLLGELSATECAAFEHALAADPDLRAQVESLRPLMSQLDALPGEAWDPPEPPPLALRLEPPRHRRLVLRPLVAAACALVLLVAGIGVGALVFRGGGDAGAQLSLAPIGGRDPAASGHVKLSGERLTLRVSGLKPTGRDHFYEAWLLGPGGRLVALGSFRVGADGTATMRLPLPVDPASYRYFDISLQPDNGSPSHSGLSVLRGRTRS